MRPQKRKKKTGSDSYKNEKEKKKAIISKKNNIALKGRIRFLYCYFITTKLQLLKSVITWVTQDPITSKYVITKDIKFSVFFKKLGKQNNNELATKLITFEKQPKKFQIEVMNIMFNWYIISYGKKSIHTLITTLSTAAFVAFFSPSKIDITNLQRRFVYNQILAILFKDSSVLLQRQEEAIDFRNTYENHNRLYALKSPIPQNSILFIPDEVMGIVFGFLDLYTKDSVNYFVVNSQWNVGLLLFLPRLTLKRNNFLNIPLIAFKNLKEYTYDIVIPMKNIMFIRQFSKAIPTVEILKDTKGMFLSFLNIVRKIPKLEIKLQMLHTVVFTKLGNILIRKPGEYTMKIQEFPKLTNLTLPMAQPLENLFAEARIDKQIFENLKFLSCGYKSLNYLKLIMEKMEVVSLFRKPMNTHWGKWFSMKTDIDLGTTILDTLKSFFYKSQLNEIKAKFPNLKKIYLNFDVYEFEQGFELIVDAIKIFNNIHPHLRTMFITFELFNYDLNRQSFQTSKIISNMKKFKEFFQKCRICFSNATGVISLLDYSEKMEIDKFEKAKLKCVSPMLQDNWTDVKELNSGYNTFFEYKYTTLNKIFAIDPISKISNIPKEFIQDLVIISKLLEIDLTVYPYGKRMRIFRIKKKI